MSNAKVERHKQERYNRKKNEKKRKIKAFFVGAAITVILAAIAFVIGLQIYNDYFKYDAIADINISDMYTALTDVQTANVADKEETEEVAEEADEHEHDHDHEEEAKSEDSEDDKESKDDESEDDKESKDDESEDKKDE